jgi:hypothetical protein
MIRQQLLQSTFLKKMCLFFATRMNARVGLESFGVCMGKPGMSWQPFHTPDRESEGVGKDRKKES